jgi:hypothetical protein
MRSLVLIFALFLIAATPAARAQMQLPGAIGAPTPAGQTIAPPAPRAQGPAGGTYSGHFAASKPPGVDSVVDRPFSLSGQRGALQIEKSGAGLRVARLTAVGDKISRPNQSCEVSMGTEGPIGLKPLGAPDGVLRYELDSTACPLQFDVLNGALRARSPNGACSFAEADCRVDASGLWGPSGGAFTEAQVKSFEKERGALENAMRSHFRTLLDKYKKDKPAAQVAIKEQAGFSSERAQVCRDYDREEAAGFCALRLTEEQDFRLQARLADAGGAKPEKKKPPRPRPPKPMAPAAPTASAPPNPQ